VIIALDIHQVIGRRELDFEDSYRDNYLGAVADDQHARLLWFGWLPHGAGQGYEAITVTGFDDIEAWDRLVERTRYGDLADWASEIDAMRYHSEGTLHVTAPWSPLDSLKLADVPVEIGDREPTTLRLDTFVPTGGAAADEKLRAAFGESDSSLIALEGCWRDAFGDLGRGDISLLYRVRDEARLREALDEQQPGARWPGSLVAATGLDDLPSRTRLVRTARWSPLG
jgi:hypothetical protein